MKTENDQSQEFAFLIAVDGPTGESKWIQEALEVYGYTNVEVTPLDVEEDTN